MRLKKDVSPANCVLDKRVERVCGAKVGDDINSNSMQQNM